MRNIIALVRDEWQRPAVCFEKIFSAAVPADLPAKQPAAFEISIDLKTANAFGASISA